MAVLATYDGGKVLVGFGKTGSSMYAGWVAKMWGVAGSTAAKQCADDAKITGYVTMVTGTSTDLAASANCTLTTNARTQWLFTTLATNGYAGTNTSRYSVIFLAGTEDFYCGKARDSCVTAG